MYFCGGGANTRRAAAGLDDIDPFEKKLLDLPICGSGDAVEAVVLLLPSVVELPFEAGSSTSRSTAPFPVLESCLTCLASFIAFFPALSSGPGQFAGTFISHLEWQLKPQSLHDMPLAERPHILSWQTSQTVGILKDVDLNL